MITYSTSIVNTFAYPSQPFGGFVRLVNSTSSQDDLALAIVTDAGPFMRDVRLYVRTASTPTGTWFPVPGVGGPENAVSIFDPDGVQSIIDLIPFPDGSYCFLYYSRISNSVFYSKVSPDGTAVVGNAQIANPFGPNFAASVLPDGSFIFFCAFTQNGNTFITGIKCNQAGVPGEMINLYHETHTSSADVSALFACRRPVGNQVVVSMQLSGTFNLFRCITVDTANMAVVGTNSLTATSGDVIASFDDALVPGGLWLIQRGTLGVLANPSTTAVSSEYATFFLISPSGSAGGTANFPPVPVAIPSVVNLTDASVPGASITGPVLSGHSVAFHPETHDLYFPAVAYSGTPQTTGAMIYTIKRQALISAAGNPITSGAVSYVPANAPANTSALSCNLAGTPSSFFAVAGNGDQKGASLLRFSAGDVPAAPPPPGSTTIPTFTSAIISSIPQLNAPSLIAGMAINQAGDIAVAYLTDLETKLKLIVRLASGVVTPEFIVATGTNVFVSHPVYGLVADNLNNNVWRIIYSVQNGSSQGLYVSKVKNDLSGYATSDPAPITVIDPTEAFINFSAFATTLVDDSLFCIFDYRSSNSLPVNIASRVLTPPAMTRGVPSLIFTAPNSSSTCTFQAGYINGDSLHQLVAISHLDPLAASPNIRTNVYSVEFISIPASSSPVLVATASSGLITSPDSFIGIGDSLVTGNQARLWVQAPTASGFIRSLFVLPPGPPNPPAAPVLDPLVPSFSGKLVSSCFVQDGSGNLYGILAPANFSKQDRLTGQITSVSVDFSSISGLNLVSMVNIDSIRMVGTADEFFAISRPAGESAQIIQINRIDVPSSPPDGGVLQVSQSHPVGVTPTPVPTRTAPFELLSIATNIPGDIAVLRFDPIDSSGSFQKKGRLFLDVFDKFFALKVPSILLVDEFDSDPVITRNDDADGRSRNVTPHVIPMPDSGDFLVIWGHRKSLQGDARFRYTRIKANGTRRGSVSDLTPPASSCWAAKATVFPDDRFVVTYIDWTPGAAFSSVLTRLFGSTGPTGDALTILNGGQLDFEKNIVVRENADGFWIAAVSSTESSTSSDKKIWISSSVFPAFSPSVAAYSPAGGVVPDQITGFADNDRKSIWLDEGAAVALLTPQTSGIFSVAASSIGDHLSPTVFRRAVFDSSGVMYGIKTHNPPSIINLSRTGSQNFLGDLKFGAIERFTGTTFTDGAIDGTGERMVVPVYRDSSKNLYSIDIVVPNSLAAIPPPAPGTPATIVVSSSPQGQIGTGYSFNVSGSGTPPFAFSATGLPPGLSISSSGLITGVPTDSGTFTATITISNSAGSTTKDLQFVITPGTPTVGLFELDGPHPTSPILAGGDSIKLPHALSASNTAFWTTHTLVRGIKQGLILQRHTEFGLLDGGQILILPPAIYSIGEVQSDVGQDVTGGGVIVYGGYADTISSSPLVVGGFVNIVRYNSTGAIVYSPRRINSAAFNGTMAHPKVFVFADATAAVVWFEGGDLKMSIVSAGGVPTEPSVVATGLNPDIVPVITGNPNSSTFMIVFSDGVGFAFRNYDKQGVGGPLVHGVAVPGERIRAIGAVQSKYDGLLTVVLSTRTGTFPFDDRVTVQRFSGIGGTVTQRFITNAVDAAEFGAVTKPIIELADGSLIVSYFKKSDNKVAMRRFNRDIAPIGPGVEKLGSPGSDFIALADMNGTIVWGYHSSTLNIFRYRVDFDIVSPLLPPGAGSIAPTACRTV